MTTIGDVIAEYRRQAGLSQSELARRAGIDKAQVSRYEAGLIVPTIATLYRVVSALDVPLDAFLAHLDAKGHAPCR